MAETQQAEKADEKKAEKIAAKQAEQDAADIETFLAAHRGEQLLRGETGSLNHLSDEAGEREERLRKEREGDK